MSEWHEGLSDEQIQQLKDNERCVQLIPAWMRMVFETMPFEDREYVYGSGWIADQDKYFVSSWTYRLRPDWKRPEKEKPKEKGKGEYATVAKSIDGERYCFALASGVYELCKAFSTVGFGGIEFEELPGEWHMGLRLFGERHGIVSVDYFGMGSPRLKPATPKRVRFWVEK